MKNTVLFLLFFFAAPAFAKTLVSITILPPADGYHITSTTGTIQLGTLCTYDDASTDNCSPITLTWGSADTADMTVNSSGLATGAGGTAGKTPNIYAYDPITGILGHHIVSIDAYSLTSLTSRPELSSSNTVTVGGTVLVSAVNSSNNGVGNFCAWTTSDPTKATVNSIGEVTGVAAGSAVITCTLNTHTVGRTITVAAPTLANNTWYVRPDGGTRYDAAVTAGQCDGKHNAAYPGSGTNQPCAFSNPMYLFTDETSSTVYTGAVQAGDTASIAPTATPYPGYQIGGKTSSTKWITSSGGSITIPSGTVGQHTKIYGANHSSCTADQDDAGNRTTLQAYYGGGISFDMRGTQNVDIACIDLGNFEDCNKGTSTYMDFACPGGTTPFSVLVDSFTANFTMTNDRIHGFITGLTGNPGPNVSYVNTSVQMNYQTGLDFDDPTGNQGNRSDGFAGVGVTASYSGCTEELPKTLTSVSRDGAGNLNVVFPTNAMVNYLTGTNLTLTGMTPSDLNGTFPVSSITFNQQTVNITGGSCTVEPGELQPGPQMCVLTTSTAPAFVQGSFVQIAGSPTSLINGYWEVFAVSGTGFSFNASPSAHPGWGHNMTIASGGTAATAASLVATAGGASESASTVGTASHVHPAHRCFDQGDGQFSNGDGVGTGAGTIGAWTCDKCTFIGNLQDGWDMLHSDMTTARVTQIYSEANEGAAAKFGNADTEVFTSGILIGNCASLLAFDPNKPADFNQYVSTPCRAGDVMPTSEHAWTKAAISNNTLMGGFNTFLDDSCTDPDGCATLPALSFFNMQNNLFIGYMDTNAPGFNSSVPAIYCGPGCNGSTATAAPWVWSNNGGFNIRNFKTGPNNQWTLASSPIVTPIPNIASFAAEANALIFNVSLVSGTPVIGAGISNSYVPTDDNAGSPFANPPSMGSLEFEGANLPTVNFNGAATFSGGVQF